MEQSTRCAPLTDTDLTAAREILNHYVRTSTATFHETALSVEEFRREVRFADPRHLAYGAHRGGELYGYGLVAPYRSRCAYRDAAEVSVYLAPDRTGHGLGPVLLACLGWKRNIGRH